MYVYRGTQFDAHTALAAPKPRKPRSAIATCGTAGGLSKHRRSGEPICDQCAEFARLYKKEWRARVKANQPAPPPKPTVIKPPKPKATPRKIAECGTVGGYARHKRLNEDRCRPCKEAYNKYSREWQAVRAKGNAGWTSEKCGTVKGFASHYYYKVPTCGDCKAAKSTADTYRYLLKQAAA